MNKNDGMNYAPVGKPQPVVQAGEFVFAAAALDHGHIYGMCNGLIEAGATLKWVYDPDPAKVDTFVQQYPQVKVADSLDVILADDDVRLVAGAAIPSERCALGLKAMTAGKDYFTDKAPLTTLEQLADAKAMVEKTGKKYAVYYSERLHVESAVFAGQLVQQGAIGRVVQTLGMGPHREGLAARTGSTIVAISAASCATSAATRSSSFCFIPATATPPWSPARCATLTTRSIPHSKILATPCSKEKTAPAAISAVTGSLLTGSPPGAMVA